MNFYRKFFSKQAIEIRILMLIIPLINAKKIYTKYETKFASLKKFTRKLSSWKEILSWIIWDFSIIQQKHALTCPGLYRLIFQSLYHTSLILPKREIDETVNFQNFSQVVQKEICPIFCGILVPHFQTGKTKTKRSDRVHEACTWGVDVAS